MLSKQEETALRDLIKKTVYECKGYTRSPYRTEVQECQGKNIYVVVYKRNIIVVQFFLESGFFYQMLESYFIESSVTLETLREIGFQSREEL